MVLSLPIGGSRVALAGPGGGSVSVKPVRHGAGPLARALYAPMFDSATTERHGRPNIARYIFLDPGSQDFFVDWDDDAAVTAALLRAEAGREPHDRALRVLIGELSTLSRDFRSQWASHDVRIRHDGAKRLQHPEVGLLELTYQSRDLPMSHRAVHGLTLYTAEPGTTSEERLKRLAGLTATPSRATRHTHRLR